MMLAVTEFCRENPDAQGSVLIERFNGTEFAELLASSQAALLDSKLEAEQMEVEFHGTVALWHQKQTKSKLDALTAKANPTPKEQVEMRDLVVQLNELKKTAGLAANNATISGYRSNP